MIHNSLLMDNLLNHVLIHRKLDLCVGPSLSHWIPTHWANL